MADAAKDKSLSRRDADGGAAPHAPRIQPRAERSGGGTFTIYKPGQGAWVRWCTAAGLGVFAAAGAAFLSEQLRRLGLDERVGFVVRTVAPAAVLAAAAYFIFWITGKYARTCEFMIATEGELKKVNWSTRREVFGATRVVIFTVFALGLILAVVDLVFMIIFSGIGVLRIDVLSSLFPPANP